MPFTKTRSVSVNGCVEVCHTQSKAAVSRVRYIKTGEPQTLRLRLPEQVPPSLMTCAPTISLPWVECRTSTGCLTGHSLGGGLASMLGKQFGDPLVTFNAPGMARAFADLQSNNPGMGVARDEDRKVLHICAFFDVVSRGTGRHMGAEGSVQRIHTGAVGTSTIVAGVVGTLVTGGNPLVGAAAAAGVTALKAHGITRMIPVLENNSEYTRPLDWL
jgi:hypothetical protein